MKKIRSRRWIGMAGLFVEEIDMNGRVTCKMYRNGRPSKIWEPVFSGYSS